MTTETTNETSSDDVSGLKNKINELFSKLKTAEKRASEAEAANEELAEKATAGDDLAKLQRDFNKLQKSLTDMTAERDVLAADLRTTRVDSAISAAIAAGNVRPEMVEAVEAVLHRKVDYTDGEASIGGKSILDFAKSYFGKEGSHFVRAPDNAGADASGNNGSKAASHSMTRDNFDINEFTMIQLDNPELANSIAEAVGRPELKSNA